MATPIRTPNTQPARVTGPKPYIPSKSYPVRLSDRLKKVKENAAASYVNASFVVDPNIKFGPTANAATITSSSPDDPSSIALNVSHRNQTKTTSYSGTLSNSPPSNRYTMTFDPIAQSFILDNVDTIITISDNQSSSPNGDGPAARDPSAHSDTGSIGSADPNNPFDWRHQFRKRKSSSPEAPALSDRDSPMPMPVSVSTPARRAAAEPKRPRVRKASTPPGSVQPRSITSSPAADDGGSDLELQLERELEPSKPKPNKKRERTPEQDQSGDGGLEIQFEDEGPRGRKKALSGLFGDQRSRGKPRSLASVASSRSRSRQPPLRRLHQDEEDGGVEIEFDNSPPPEESDVDVSEMEVGSPVHRRRSSSLAAASDEGNDDFAVEPEPDHDPEPEPEQTQQREPVHEQEQEQEQEFAVEEDDDADDMMEAFEEAFEQMGEDQPGAGAVEQGYESEVSEAD